LGLRNCCCVQNKWRQSKVGIY